MDYPLSIHAQKRMSQRGITAQQVQHTIRFGRRKRIRRATIFFFGKKEMQQIARYDRKLSLALRNTKNLHVVVNQSGTISTVYKNRQPNLIPLR